jgi:hypothetical protein
MTLLKRTPTEIFIEIKLSETLSCEHIKNIVSLRKLFHNTEDYIIYAGQDISDFHGIKFINRQNDGQF